MWKLYYVASAKRVWGEKKMFLTCKEDSVWLCEPGAALQPELHLYKPTDTITLEHVVLIVSRARPRPVKALVHSDHSLCCSNENHMPGLNPNAPISVPVFSHVLSHRSPVPKPANNGSVFIQLFQAVVSLGSFSQTRFYCDAGLCWPMC